MDFHNAMLSELPPADFGRLRPHLVKMSVARGHTFFGPGDVVDEVYFPISAVLSHVIPMRDGREVETHSVGFESCVGLAAGMSGAQATGRAFAFVAGDVVALSAAILRRHAGESRPLMDLVFQHIGLAAGLSEQATACNALHDVQARLAKWLLTTHDRIEEQDLRLTQEYLAMVLGVQRTTVTAIATALKRIGVIKYSRGKLEVLDRAKLEKIACECFSVDRVNTSEFSTSRRLGAGANPSRSQNFASCSEAANFR